MKIIDGIFSPERCAALIDSLQDPTLRWVHYDEPDFEFRKSTISEIKDMPDHVVEAISELHELCPVGLKSDPNYGARGFLWGGGVHRTSHGGYLAMHKDFNVLPTTYKEPLQYERVANLIVYLNWADGGELYLEDGTCVRPEPGRGALFDPRDTFHGHPWPLRSKTPRYSLAVYFYRPAVIPLVDWRSTLYQPLPFREEGAILKQKIAARADARLRYRKYWPEGS